MPISFRRKSGGKGERNEVTGATIKELHDLLVEKDGAVNALQAEVQRLTKEQLSNGDAVMKRHLKLEPVIHMVDEKSTKSLAIGRHASMATATALRNIAPYKKKDPLAQKMASMFKKPEMFADYLKSEKFAQELVQLCQMVAPLFEEEPRCVFLQSPTYVFGDIHGNLEDLNFFADNIWKLGMNVTAGKFLFLGDYVDRGMQGLEVLAYLFALKIENPDKLFMLRGNHELRDVNGWIEHYGDRSFLWQCQARFGDELGEDVWEACNSVFDRLPLAGVIDHDIFCAHGGIPRRTSSDLSVPRLQDMLSVPSVAGVCPPNEAETFESQQIASDCLWSDPARDEQEMELDEAGFGESLRGGGAICFGEKAISDFLEEGGLSYIIRAHEAHSEGVSLSKGAKVFTVFSTSKDHGQGAGAMCGCILVDVDRLLVINRSIKYKNKYVHRRDSVSLINLTMAELDKRAELGLVVADEEDGGGRAGGDDDEEEEEEDGEDAYEGYYDEAVGEYEYEDDGRQESKSSRHK